MPRAAWQASASGRPTACHSAPAARPGSAIVAIASRASVVSAPIQPPKSSRRTRASQPSWLAGAARAVTACRSAIVSALLECRAAV